MKPSSSRAEARQGRPRGFFGKACWHQKSHFYLLCYLFYLMLCVRRLSQQTE